MSRFGFATRLSTRAPDLRLVVCIRLFAKIPGPNVSWQAEADSASNPVEAISTPVPPPQTTLAQASRLHAPEGQERSEGPCLSLEFDANMDHDLHDANDGEFQLRSSSPTTQTPAESSTNILSFEVVGGLEAMDIYGEDVDDDVDFDLDALNLAYLDEEAPPPLLPLPAATIDSDSTINTDAASSCNKEILMAFEDPGEEGENGEEDFANATSLRDSPSRPPPSSSASTSGPASASPSKRKRKRNGWIRRKRGRGQRGQSSRAPPAPVSATENMSYEEWSRSVLSSVTGSRRRCGSSHVSSKRADSVAPASTSCDGEIANSKEPEGVGRHGPDWEGKDAAGEGAASMEAPPSDDRKKPSEPLKIRIKIPSSLSLESLLPRLPSSRPNVESPSPSTASTPVVSADVPSSPVLVPVITSTAVPPSFESPEPEVAAGSSPSPDPTPIHLPTPTSTPTSTPAPLPSPIPSYAPRIPITTKRLPAACAGPRCMNLLATELGYVWKMSKLCRVQARRYQHVRKYGDGRQCVRSESEDSRGSGEIDVAIQEKEKDGGDRSVGVEKKSVQFADDDEVFVIEPRAEGNDETGETEVPRRRQSYSNSSRQFIPHLEPSRAMKRFQTVEKLLEMLDEQMKAFLCARNMWVEWRMWIKEGRWPSPDADSGVTVEERRKSPTSREGSGLRTQEINGVAELITDANDIEKPGPYSGRMHANDLDTSRCYASIQAMDVEPPTFVRTSKWTTS
ncbi:hypothetical protein PLEOSDRAFT_1098472 [Pleurotus ostreatus PC15]|uniref:Uncharacterized protein n=1 Tax=Pleurotus ostreatus (strain PC15) TaxID=1137138 RepID=A0A067P9A1_PLEO1|nr:hypothetical protein PLEOSDRAFT_1098472 [Pleurotus ostreatus PC15]